MIALAVGGVMLALGGAVAFVAALTPPAARPEPRSRRPRPTFDTTRLGAALAGGVVAGLVTRWPVAAAGGVALGWWAPTLLQGRSHQRVEARTEAIATWCELLRDAAGTARGIEGMLVATANSAPGPIRPAVQRLARRLEHEPIDAALTGLAHDLAHPLGDLVVTALRLAATAGSRRVRQVLDDLATAAHLEASMQRRVDVARQRPRATMRLVALVVASFVAGLALLAREYLAPYGTPVGQLVLVVVLGYWGLGFWWMHRMGQPATVERFLAPPDGAS